MKNFYFNQLIKMENIKKDFYIINIPDYSEPCFIVEADIFLYEDLLEFVFGKIGKSVENDRFLRFSFLRDNSGNLIMLSYTLLIEKMNYKEQKKNVKRIIGQSRYPLEVVFYESNKGFFFSYDQDNKIRFDEDEEEYSNEPISYIGELLYIN